MSTPLPEVLLAVLAAGPLAGARRLGLAELDAPDLPADRLRQVGELQPPDPLVRGEVMPAGNRARRETVRWELSW
jgi:hypothetical protein